MADKEAKPSTDASLDLLGIKPVGDAINKVTEATVDGAMGFLRLICRPAAEEFGYLLQDHVKVWRATNAAQLVKKAEAKYKALGYPPSFKASPRLVSTILEKGSWTDDDNLQDMWSGLLTSSCSEDGKEDSNLIFTNLLSQLTSLEAVMLNYMCIETKKKYSNNGSMLVETKHLASREEICEAFKEEDISRICRESEHLNSLGLTYYIIGDKSRAESYFANVGATRLGFHLFVRCQGSTLDPDEYFFKRNL